MKVGKINFGPYNDNRKSEEIRPDQPNLQEMIKDRLNFRNNAYPKYYARSVVDFSNLEKTLNKLASKVSKNNRELKLTPGGHPMFNQLLVQISKLHAKKNSDYAGDDPLSNFMECEKIGIPAWKGIWVRLTDKYSRAKNLIVNENKKRVKDESLEDTLQDLAVYSLLAIILLREVSKGDSQITKEED